MTRDERRAFRIMLEERLVPELCEERRRRNVALKRLPPLVMKLPPKVNTLTTDVEGYAVQRLPTQGHARAPEDDRSS